MGHIREIEEGLIRERQGRSISEVEEAHIIEIEVGQAHIREREVEEAHIRERGREGTPK